MSHADVLTTNPSDTDHSTHSYDSDGEFGSTVAGRISSFSTNQEETSVAKLPGTALLKSVHNKRKSLNASNHTLQSDKTYDFDKKNDPYDSITEFGDDSVRSLNAAVGSSPPEPVVDAIPNGNGRVPAWKLRQQALRKNSPPPPRISDRSSSPLKSNRPPKQPNNFRRSSLRNIRKTNPDAGTTGGNGRGNNDPNGDKSWLQRLRTKKETEEDKEKRIKRESLIEKQVSSRWGKDILEEDSDEDEGGKEKKEAKKTNDEKEEKDEVEDGNDDGNGGDDESEETDTVKKVKSLIEKSFGSALVATIKKDKEAKAPDASVFARDSNDVDDDGDDAGKNPRPNRGNRWAMMGSAAMTSVRNLQRGLIGDGEKKKNDEDGTAQPSETIAEGDESDSENKDEDGDKVSEEMNNRRNFMWKNRGAAAFTSVRNAWEGATRRRSLGGNDDDGDDADDEKSVQSEPDRLDRGENDNNNNLLFHIGNFVRYHRAKFDAEVWADPEIQESVKAIEKLRTKLQDSRTEHRSETRRREKQVENSIRQQKIFLARKLHRLTYGYKKDPFHPCIREVYEKEIRIIVHEATSLFGNPDAEHEKDDIDAMLDSSRFDYDPEFEKTENDNATTRSGDGSIIDQFFGRKTIGDDRSVDTLDDDSMELEPENGRTINRDSLIPLETRLLRAQHNEWMTDHQMKLARTSSQQSVGYFIDLLPELRVEHEKIKAIPQSSVDTKIREMEESNAALKKAYEAHLEAQEKLLAIYRERYVPSVHEDEKDEESVTNKDKPKETDDDDDDENGEKDDTFGTPPTTPIKHLRPNLWAKNISQSVRGLFGPKKDDDDENEEDEKDKETNNSVGDTSQNDDSGFSLSSPLTGGSQGKNKFLLSFGSPAGSAARSGILANFTAPPLTTATTGSTNNDDANTDAKDSTKQSLQESAADSAEAVWKVPEPVDKGSLPETGAEKRARRAAERAAARKANRPDALSTGGTRTSVSGAAASSSTSRSELLERARKARQESTDALKSQGITSPASPTPSARSGRTGRTGRASLRSTAGGSTITGGSGSRKELSMRDLLEKAGESRRKLQENDSRMESLAQKKNQLKNASPLNSPSGSIRKTGSSGERRRRIVRELNHDESLQLSSDHSLLSSEPSLHERKPRGRLMKPTATGKKPWHNDEEEEELRDVNEFGDAEQ